MRYLGEDEVTGTMGLGYLGEVRQAPDGQLYQWVEGVDGLGNPVGFWKKLVRRAAPFLVPGGAAMAMGQRLLRQAPVRGLLRRALPFAQSIAPFVPGFGPAAAAALRVATPALREAGITGYGGLGALYQAPDGTVYQMRGFAEEEELRGLAEEEELRGLAEDEELRGLAEDEELRGLGALYQAPDGTLYQVQGLAEDEELRGLDEDEELRGLAEEEELRGFAEEEELRGLAEDDELRGFAEEEELRGFAEEEELRGFAEEEELRGFAEDEELRGFDQGYVRESDVSGLDAYVPTQPPTTRWFRPPAHAPELWKPLW
jgi:hypothetical protein